MTTGARVGTAILAIFVTGALFAPWITPVGPSDVTDVVATRFLAPLTVDQFGVFHLLGTDRLGRDVWSRLVHGARMSLLVAALATAVSLILGVIMGGLAAILRGWPARLVLGVTDFALALPRVVILLLLAALWQPSATLVVLTLGLTGWMPIARLTYGEALVQLKRPYTESARALGASRARVFARHVLPNAASPLLAAATLGIGNAITLEAGLSFLGLGVQPPVSSWGTLIASGRDTIVNAPWVGLVPGVALVTVVVAATLVANWFELDRTRTAS